MHRGLSNAVIELRARTGLSQEDLANKMCKVAARMGSPIRPDRITVCRWENMDTAPNAEHRMVLARIAGQQKKTEDLAELFRAPVSAWRLVGYVKLRPTDETEEP
jgi:transcriptional regulator with XRE-family HTH domain